MIYLCRENKLCIVFKNLHIREKKLFIVILGIEKRSSFYSTKLNILQTEDLKILGLTSKDVEY